MFNCERRPRLGGRGSLQRQCPVRGEVRPSAGGGNLVREFEATYALRLGMVPGGGFEPPREPHTPLKRTRLPIPPSRQVYMRLWFVAYLRNVR